MYIYTQYYIVFSICTCKPSGTYMVPLHPWFQRSRGWNLNLSVSRCLNSKLLRNPRLAWKRAFLGTQWGSWDHEHWMHIKKGIHFQFLLVYHISTPKWWKWRVWHLDFWWTIVEAALDKCLCTASCSLWGGFRSGRQWNNLKWPRILMTHGNVRFAYISWETILPRNQDWVY